MKNLILSCLIAASVFVFQSCSGDNTATLETREAFPLEAEDITKILGTIDRQFIEKNFLNSSRDVGVFYFFKNELRLLSTNLIPSQHEKRSTDSISLRFNQDLSLRHAVYSGASYIVQHRYGAPCTQKLPTFEDNDNDDMPKGLKWKTACKYQLEFSSDDQSPRSHEEYNVDIEDSDDQDPFSSFRQDILYKIVRQRKSKFNNTINASEYALPAISWASILKEKINAVKNSDLNYSISLDRTRRAVTGDGRKSGVGLRINVNAFPKVFKRHETVKNGYIPGYGEGYERDFVDLTIDGNFQIVDGFVQFVIEDKVWNLKISSTPISYQYYFPSYNPYQKSKIDPEQKCAENFAGGSIFIEDISGNKFEFRYSQNALDLPIEQNPGQCNVEYFFNDQAIVLN